MRSSIARGYLIIERHKRTVFKAGECMAANYSNNLIGQKQGQTSMYEKDKKPTSECDFWCE